MRAGKYTVDERDEIVLLSKEREPLEAEYVDELTLESLIKPENVIQLIDQMEIYKMKKPENEIEALDEVIIYGTPFEWKNLITEKDSLTLLSVPKPQPINNWKKAKGQFLKIIEFFIGQFIKT